MKKKKKQGRRITRKPRDLLALYRLQYDFLDRMTQIPQLRGAGTGIGMVVRTLGTSIATVSVIDRELKTYEIKLPQSNLEWMPFIQKHCHKPRFHRFGVASAYSREHEGIVWFIVRLKLFNDDLLQHALIGLDGDRLADVLTRAIRQIDLLRFRPKLIGVPYTFTPEDFNEREVKHAFKI